MNGMYHLREEQMLSQSRLRSNLKCSMGLLPQSKGSESRFQYFPTSLQSRRQCSFSQMDQAILERSTNCPIAFLTSSTFIQRMSSTSFLSNFSRSASLTPFATKKQVELPWVSNQMRMRVSNLPAMEMPVSSSTSRTAQFSGGSCWFHLPLGKPNLSLTLMTSSLEQSLLKMMAPHTGLFSCNLTISSCGLSFRHGGLWSLSLKRNQLRCFSQSFPGLVRSTSSTQQQKAFSAWQLKRVASSCSSRGRFSRNLATIPSNTSRSPIHPNTLFYYSHPSPVIAVHASLIQWGGGMFNVYGCMGMYDQSDEVQLALQFFTEEFVFEDFWVELGTLLGVLEDAGDLDRACPVDVVEALTEDQFLQHSLLHLGVRVHHAVVIGDCRPAVRCLRHHVEIIVVGDDVRRHQCSCRHIAHVIALSKETLAGLNIDHDHGDGGDVFAVGFLQLVAEDVDVELLEHGDLVAGGGGVEDEYFRWGFLIPGEVSVHGLQGQCHHSAELLLCSFEGSGAAEDGGEGGVYSRTHAQRALGAFFHRLEGEHHSGGQVGRQTGYPEGIAALGNDLEEDLGGDALQVLLPEGGISGDLANDLVVQQCLPLHLLVLRSQLVRQDDQADVALLLFHRLLQHIPNHRNRPPKVKVPCVQFHNLQLHTQVARSGLEGIKQTAGVLAGEVDDSAADGVLAGEDGLVVEVEEGFLPLLDRVVLPQGNPRHRDDPALDGLQTLVDADADLLEGLELRIVPQLPHELQYLAVLLVGRANSIFGYLLAPKLIEVVGNASHEAEFGEQVDLELFVAATLAFDTKEGLFGVTDGYVVFGEVVLAQGHVGILELDALQVLEDHLLDFVITCFPVISHHNLALQLPLQDVTLLVLILVLVELVDLVYHLKDSLVADDLLGRVHAQVVTLLKEDEVRAVPREHHEVVDGGLLGSVEVLARTTDLRVVQLPHDAPESVVEEAQQQLRVFLHLQHLHLPHVHLMFPSLHFELLALCSLRRVDVVPREDGQVDLGSQGRKGGLQDLPAEGGVVVGDLGRVLEGEDVDFLEGLDLHVEVVGGDGHGAELTGIGPPWTQGQQGETSLALELHQKYVERVGPVFKERQQCTRMDKTRQILNPPLIILFGGGQPKKAVWRMIWSQCQFYYKMAGKQGSIKRPLPKQGYSPDLNKYVAKKLRIKLNGGREIEGIVIGVDVFMNLALEKAFEISGSERKILYKIVVRGSSILMWELLEKVIG